MDAAAQGLLKEGHADSPSAKHILSIEVIQKNSVEVWRNFYLQEVVATRYMYKELSGRMVDSSTSYYGLINKR